MYIMQTRFHEDDCRVVKQLQQSTDPCRYVLDTPMYGEHPCFINDVHIIPQKWGANLWTNTIDLQSKMLGLNKSMNRDCITNEYTRNTNIGNTSYPIMYSNCENPFMSVEQTRAILPAWTLKGKYSRDIIDTIQSEPVKDEPIPIIPFLTNYNSRMNRL